MLMLLLRCGPRALQRYRRPLRVGNLLRLCLLRCLRRPRGPLGSHPRAAGCHVVAADGTLHLKPPAILQGDEPREVVSQQLVQGARIVEDNETEAAVLVRGACVLPVGNMVPLHPGFLHAPIGSECGTEIVLAHVLGHTTHEDLASLRRLGARPRGASSADSAFGTAELVIPVAIGRGSTAARTLGQSWARSGGAAVTRLLLLGGTSPLVGARSRPCTGTHGT
mmetsp:Transcript_9563/g.21923  ORF Transcript_9563/g.21923 Transcript_9563/m.21923 type:complete len:223 (+) Transcript_9563:773-1441(+)